jgi:hypothetical protein
MVDYMLQFDVNSRLCLGHLDLQSWAFLISLFLDPQRWGDHRIWEALGPPKKNPAPNSARFFPGEVCFGAAETRGSVWDQPWIQPFRSSAEGR